MEKAKIVIMCIGTMSIMGDSVAPRIGKLLRDESIDAFVYGTPDNPISAGNIKYYETFIKAIHKECVVIAVDAALGKQTDVGMIKFTENGVRPCGAFDTTRERVGDIGVLVVVGRADKDRMNELKTAKLETIDTLARKTSEVLVGAVKIWSTCNQIKIKIDSTKEIKSFSCLS